MKRQLEPIIQPQQIKALLAQFKRPITPNLLAELTKGYYQKNSLLAFSKDWNHFVEFCQLKAVTPLPASVTAVRLYLEKEARHRKFSTIRRYYLTISLIHYLLNQKDPTNSRHVRQLMQQLRIEKHGDEKQADCFTREHLEQLYEKLKDNKSYLAIRDLALYHLMFECAMKRGELKKLTFSALADDFSSLTLANANYQLSTTSQRVLKRWVECLPIRSGTVFRSIDRHGNIHQGELDDSSIYRILRRAGQLIDQPHLKFSGQSTRIGAVKELAEQGYDTKDIQHFGRWLCPAMPNQYLGNLNSAQRDKLKFIKIKPWD